jgi:hypothetical protein
MNESGGVTATDPVAIGIVKGAPRTILAKTGALAARTSMCDVVREKEA